MSESNKSINVLELEVLISAKQPPLLLDVRRRALFERESHMISGAHWCDHQTVAAYVKDRMAPGREIIVYCVHGHEISQGARASLEQAGFPARFLEGGFEAWREAGLPLADRSVER